MRWRETLDPPLEESHALHLLANFQWMEIDSKEIFKKSHPTDRNGKGGKMVTRQQEEREEDHWALIVQADDSLQLGERYESLE